MKYIGILSLVALLSWSWWIIHHEVAVPQQVHVGIQQDLKKIIADYIQQNLPNSKDLRFDRFWTQTLNKDRVKASFLYSFDDTTNDQSHARVQIDGYAILNRDKGESDEQKDTWSFDELYIMNNQIEFKDPLVINPGKGDAPNPEGDSQ
jgi:hypothetical protein